MKKIRLTRLCGVLALLALTSCGGGGAGSASPNPGNDGNDGGASSSASGAWLTFAPVTLTLPAGVAQPFTISANASQDQPNSAEPVIVDSQGVTTGAVSFSSNYTATPIIGAYKAAMTSSPNLQAGDYRGNFTFYLYTDHTHTAQYPGSPWSIPYHITINPRYVAHKLLPMETGVGFSSVPGWSRLSRTIAIRDNLAKSTAWSAHSDQSWLSVTPSGTTGGSGGALTLNANPANLAMDAISYATVTITSTDPTVQPVEKIVVGLWRGSVAPQNVSLPLAYSTIVADPVAPLVYAAGASGSIDVINSYTQQTVASIATSLPVDSMTVSADGSMLYALSASAFKVAVIDLSARRQVSSWSVVQPITGSIGHIKYIRPNGVGVVLSDDGQAYLASNGKEISDATGLGGINVSGESTIAASSDGRIVFSENRGISPATITRFDVDYSDTDGGTLVMQVVKQGTGVSENGQQIATNTDGSRLYVASGAPYNIVELDPLTLAAASNLAGGIPYPSYVAVGSDGRVFSLFGALLNVNAVDGTLLKSSYLTEGAYELQISPDGVLVVANTGDMLSFMPVPP